MSDQDFTPEQEQMLAAPLDMRHIKHRRGGGSRMLAYVTGKTAIDAANHIFGYGKWGYKVLSRTHEQCGDEKKGVIEYYTADIELYVLAAAFPFPGDGMGIVTAPYTVEMHEKARKEAVTDALKRALRHYGDQFGLALYDEDAYVEAPDGSRVQVKEVPINDKSQQKQQPRRVVEAKTPRAIAAQTVDLDEQIKQAKLRARALGVAQDASEWQKLLDMLHINYIGTSADVATINNHLTKCEQSMQSTQSA